MINTADVIVIGSGIVGSATAYELAKRGLRVTVLEKYTNVGDGASSRNGAGVRLGGRVSPEAELAAKAIYEIWPTLGEELDADLEYVRAGSLTLAHSESQIASLDKKLAKDRKAGAPSQLVDGKEAREICPYLSDYVEKAVWSEMDGHANPMVTTLAYYRAARRLGVRYITGENVVALEKRQGRIRRVITEAGTVYEADKVVLAAGFNSRRIAKTVGLWIPFLKRVDECLITEVQPPMFQVRVSCADGNFYGSQTKHGSFIFGGNTNPRDKDTVIARLTVTRGTDGECSVTDVELIPCACSGVTNGNNYQPVPYEEGSEEYERTISKLEGTFTGANLTIPYDYGFNEYSSTN